jgi:hypothetical protein
LIHDGITNKEDLAEGNSRCQVLPAYVRKEIELASLDEHRLVSPSVTGHDLIQSVEL